MIKMPRHFSFFTKLLVAVLILNTLGVLWKSSTIYFDHNGVVAGAVVSNASVEPNPYNLLDQQLQSKEAALRQQEIELLTTQHERDRRIMSYLFTVAGALLVLIAINFYLDFRRNGGRRLVRA